MDIWTAVREERLDLADRLEPLSTLQWDSPSLCPEWRIRDVLGHVVAGAQGLYSVRARGRAAPARLQLQWLDRR